MAQLDVIKEFRDDHRRVRDDVLQLADAFQRCDVAKAREVLGGINEYLGPHFRFEEEMMYPTLRRFLGEYVDQLLAEHDQAITVARAGAQLLQNDQISGDDGRGAASAVRGLLVHVSNCDGLAVLSERLDTAEMDALSDTLVRCREAGVPLLEWAEKLRERKIAAA